MEFRDTHSILAKLIAANGDEYQEKVAIEECSELIQAICHKHRGREHKIAEDIADVEIMIEQLKIINNCSEEVSDFKEKKMELIKSKVESAVKGRYIETRNIKQ